MQPLKAIPGLILCDVNGIPVGVMGANGKEYLFPTQANSNTGTQPDSYYRGLVSISGGTINGTTLGATNQSTVKASDYQAARTDLSGTPGNATINTPRGRAAFAAASGTVIITSSLVTATSSIFIQLNSNDATLIRVVVTAAAGSFTVTGNANATAITTFDFHIIN